MSRMEPSIAYLVHDLADPAVTRRVRVLLAGGGRLTLAGFRRCAEPVGEVAGVAATDLGRTEDARLVRRAARVALAALAVAGWGRRCRGHDLLIARNLEMLALAWLARRLFAPRAALVYELLDIHGLMVATGPVARLLRRLERALLRDCREVIVSSPAFVERYLDRHQPGHPPARLVENKVFPAAAVPAAPTRLAGPPWRIGWFGNIRCRRSLDCLIAVARRHPDLIAVDIRGVLACASVRTLPQEIAALPNLVWHGRYDAADLPEIYGRVHFSWAIDYYQAGFNSDWLLPNRLYESCLHGSLPLAVASVETGRWLARHRIGQTLAEPLDQSLATFLTDLTPARHRALAEALAACDPGLFRLDGAGCRALVETLGGGGR